MTDIEDRDRLLFWWGRCKSGKRWFWHVYDWRGFDAEESERERYSSHGWADTEAEAHEAAMQRVRAAAGDLPFHARAFHSVASRELRRVNARKRQERITANPSDGTDGAVIEYLYSARWSDFGDYDGSQFGLPREWEVYRFRIVKKTKKRIYYHRAGERIDKPDPYPHMRDLDTENVGYIDRQKFEGWDRSAKSEWLHTEPGTIHTRNYYSRDDELYAEPPPRPVYVPQTPEGDTLNEDTLKRLKAEMAAAHPDKGGSDEAFRDARARYVEARRRLEKAA